MTNDGLLPAGILTTSGVAVAVKVSGSPLGSLAERLTTRSVPLLASVGLGFAYGLYAAFAMVALLFVLKVLPETRGRRLG